MYCDYFMQLVMITYDIYYVLPGVDNNQTIKLFGSGGADPDGNRPGDLYVTIRVICLHPFAILSYLFSLVVFHAKCRIFSPFLLYCRSEKTLFSVEKVPTFMLMLS